MNINIPNVVSLFDGIACARVALGKLGYKKVTYYASEIDKNTIEIALKNFPDIKHIGGVATVNKFNYPHIAGGGYRFINRWLTMPGFINSRKTQGPGRRTVWSILRLFKN